MDIYCHSVECPGIFQPVCAWSGRCFSSYFGCSWIYLMKLIVFTGIPLK